MTTERMVQARITLPTDDEVEAYRREIVERADRVGRESGLGVEQSQRLAMSARIAMLELTVERMLAGALPPAEQAPDGETDLVDIVPSVPAPAAEAPKAKRGPR